MSIIPARLVSTTFFEHDELGPVPDRVTVEVDATALAWLVKQLGKLAPIDNPGGESSHFYEVGRQLMCAFYDDAQDDVATSPVVPYSLAALEANRAVKP